MTGELPAFKRLSADTQLQLLREYPKLLPRLLKKGLEPDDAMAVAYNAALLFRVLDVSPPVTSPWEVLTRYSLGEIAELCEIHTQVEAGCLEYGAREDDG